MGRLAFSLVFCLAVAISVLNVSEGKCSQFGHSCFGAHGKRADDKYGNLEPVADLYPPTNQLEDAEDPRFPVDEPIVSNPRALDVGTLMNLMGRLLRQRSAAQQQQQQQQQLRPSPVQLGPNEAYLH